MPAMEIFLSRTPPRGLPSTRRAQAKWWFLALAASLGGCARLPSPAPLSPAVQEQARIFPEPPAQATPAQAREPRPNVYRVVPGDSLIRIGLDLGHSWRDIARLNQLRPPYMLQAGRLLKLPEAPPESLDAAKTLSPREELVSGPGPSGTAAAVPSANPAGEASTKFQWPGGTGVLADFATAGKGIDIDGRMGWPVHAAADGRVVYAGSALPGYGQVVILKHDEIFLSAYGHNQRLLVKEGALVQRGETIALMGRSGTDRVKLHFELRRLGVPVDPLTYVSPGRVVD